MKKGNIKIIFVDSMTILSNIPSIDCLSKFNDGKDNKPRELTRLTQENRK